MSYDSGSQLGGEIQPDAVKAVTVSPFSRLCKSCMEPLPAARLAAMPGALLCVSCLEHSGDVPILRRFDEWTPQGDRIETLFTADRRILRQMEVSNNRTSFTTVDDDDSELTVEGNQTLDVARSLASIMVEGDETEVERCGQGRGVRERKLCAAA